MKLKPFKLAPGLIAFGVIAIVCLIQIVQYYRQPEPGDPRAAWGLLERVERMTYDMRARRAAKSSPLVTTNLGFVYINEDSLKAVWDRSLGYSFGLLWPRQVYGRLVEELSDQGAKAVALDVIFSELRPDHPLVVMASGGEMESDEFFAMQMQRSSNAVIAISPDTTPPLLFLTNASAVGHITTEKDPDGILRQVRAFLKYTNWNSAFLLAQQQYKADLANARFVPGKVILPLPGGETAEVPLDKDGNFDWVDFVGKVPKGHERKEKPLTGKIAWHMGIVLAAKELGLDLDRAEIDLANRRIKLHGTNGVERVIPVDAQGYFFVDWCVPPNHPLLTQEPIESLLMQNKLRLEGKTDEITNRWKDKLVVVGSSALIGNNLTDRGATPLDKDTLLVSKHWNVANTIITGRFVQRAPLWLDLCLIALLGIVIAWITWQLRVLVASALVTCIVVAYVIFAFVLYAKTRYWLPVVLPVMGSMVMNHLFLVIWRVIFEQADKRRIRSTFSKVVSPKIVNELLGWDSLEPARGARREITVLFADVRGFTSYTDLARERVDEYVRANKLTAEAAEECYNVMARETLDTVNLYLGLIADVIKKHDGTLDKFIGDCVMAFWGAPFPQKGHASLCVKAAIDAQRTMYDLNVKRAEENNKIQLENLTRQAAGLPPKPMHAILLLGTGINTGVVTAGLMGSAQAELSYTAFGREVNLASRLESASGRGRIFIGTETYAQIKRDDPELAATCVEQPGLKLKGFSGSVVVYEVPWRPPGASPLDEEFSGGGTVPGEGTTFTGFVQRGST